MTTEHKPQKVEGGRPRGATSLDATASNQHREQDWTEEDERALNNELPPRESNQHSGSLSEMKRLYNELAALYEQKVERVENLQEQLEATEGELAGSRFCVERLQEQVEALRNFNEATRAAYATLSGVSSDPPEDSGAGPGPLGPAPNPASGLDSSIGSGLGSGSSEGLDSSPARELDSLDVAHARGYREGVRNEQAQQRAAQNQDTGQPDA